jgi:hypothetical protein
MGPGSAKQHFVLHRVRDTSACFRSTNFKQPSARVLAPRELGFWLIPLFEGRRDADRRILVTAAAYFPDCRETEAHGNASQRPAAAFFKDLGPLFEGTGGKPTAHRSRRISRRHLHLAQPSPWQAPIVGPGGVPRPPESAFAKHSRGRRIDQSGFPLSSQLSLCPTSERLMKRPSLDRTRAG